MQLLSAFGNADVLKVISVLAKYKDLVITDLTPAIASEVVSALGVEVTLDPTMYAAVISAMQQDDVEKLADLANNPATVQRLMEIVKGPDVVEIVRPCGHCGLYNSYQVQLP